MVTPFPECNYWRFGTEFQKLFSSCCSARVICSSRAGLSGSGSHKLIVLNTEHSPLAAESWNTLLIISLRLTSRASLSSPFSSPCCMTPTVQPFCPASLVSWARVASWIIDNRVTLSMHEPMCNVKILHHSQIGQDVYIYGICVYHTYNINIYIYV